MKKYIIIFIAGMLSVLTACQKELVCPNYLNIDKTSYTFGAEVGNITVNVDSNVPWKVAVENAEKWLSVEKKDGGVVINVLENDGMERNGVVTFLPEGIDAVRLSINQLCREFAGKILYDDSRQYSPNGMFSLIVKQMSSGGVPVYEVYMENSSTGDIVRLKDVDSKIRNGSDVVGISDMGHVLFLARDGYCAIWHEGVEKKIELSLEYASVALAGISSDGNVICGTARKSDPPRPYVPFRWNNGTLEELPLPEQDMLGNAITTGAFVSGMSDDGSVIWGYDNVNVNYKPVEGIIYWKDGEYHYVGLKSSEIKTYTQSGREKQAVSLIRKQSMMAGLGVGRNGCKISPDGKYILAEYYTVDIEDDKICKEHYYPALINTDTDEYTIFDTQDDMSPISVSDEGHIFAVSPYFSSSMLAKDGTVLLPDGTVYSMQDYFMGKYGIKISNQMMIIRAFSGSIQYSGMKLTGTSAYGGIYQNFTLFVK